MKTFVRMFRPEFWDAILEGRKKQTVRLKPVRMPAPGDTIDIRGRNGKPYGKNATQERLATATITFVGTVIVRSFNVEVDGVLVDRDLFALQDGFADGAAMWRWFAEIYGLASGDSFSGIVIGWGGLC